MFLTLGFKSVTMDDIAAQLGISKKTIYQHFANKNDLVEATAMYLFDTISAGIDAICKEEKNPIEEFFIIRQFLSRILKNDTVSPDFQFQKYFPNVFTLLRTMQFEKLHGSMLDNLRRGMREGLYRPDIDIEFTARIYFTGLTGIKNTDIFPTEMFAYSKITIQFIEYHLRAIVTDKGLQVLTKTIAENNFKKN